MVTSDLKSNSTFSRSGQMNMAMLAAPSPLRTTSILAGYNKG